MPNNNTRPRFPVPSCYGPLAGMRIVAVDDDVDMQTLLRYHLTRFGATLDVCDNGLLADEHVAESLRRIGFEQPIDVVLMDIKMPVLDGYNATARLRLSGYEGRIIALTAQSGEDQRQQCFEAGCDDFITKPFCPEALLRSLKRRAPYEELDR